MKGIVLEVAGQVAAYFGVHTVIREWGPEWHIYYGRMYDVCGSGSMVTGIVACRRVSKRVSKLPFLSLLRD